MGFCKVLIPSVQFLLHKWHQRQAQSGFKFINIKAFIGFHGHGMLVMFIKCEPPFPSQFQVCACSITVLTTYAPALSHSRGPIRVGVFPYSETFLFFSFLEYRTMDGVRNPSNAKLKAIFIHIRSHSPTSSDWSLLYSAITQPRQSKARSIYRCFCLFVTSSTCWMVE